MKKRDAKIIDKMNEITKKLKAEVVSNMRTLREREIRTEGTDYEINAHIGYTSKKIYRVKLHFYKTKVTLKLSDG